MIKLTCDINRLNTITHNIIKKINDRDIILLHGVLGSGKTTFVKFIIKHLGGNINNVTSPTYNIINTYKLYNIIVYHFDLYKLKSYEEIYNTGLLNFTKDKSLLIIEWGLLTRKIFDKYYEISFNFCKKKKLRNIFIPNNLL